MEIPVKGSRIPYLDGLRAYSILLVVLAHASDAQAWLAKKAYPQIFLPDAALGVRIFFVPSGFIITSLLLNERDATGRISIRGFYERRIARIIPASYLYIATIAVLTALRVTSVPLSSFLAAITYTVNLHMLWSHVGASMQAAKFGHFWTLSIEEQFYLFWPGILVFLGSRWSRRLAITCVFLFSFFRMVVYPYALHQPFGPGPLRTIQDVIMWGALGAFAAHSGLVGRMRAHRFHWAYPWISGLIFSG
jgi:peptidoglycan/LPS O-acetylase OafA/YrhL